MKGSKKAPGDKDNKNGKNGRNNPDNKHEHNDDEKKKEKFKLSYKIKKFGKSIPGHLKEFSMKNIPKKKKSEGSEMLPLNPDMTMPDQAVIDEYDEQNEEQKGLLEETKALKQKIYSDGSIDNEKRNELYMCLEKRIFRVIKDSISYVNGNELKGAVQAIVEQVREHQEHPPCPWTTKWKECVGLSVMKRINRLPKFSPTAPGSCLSQVLLTLGKAMKSDLIHVIQNLKPHYPEEFDVCNTYAQQYHQWLQTEICLITEYELYVNDIHCLLTWIKTLYPNILRDQALIDHINVAQLGDLLPLEKICHLENMYILYQKGLLEQWMTNALAEAEKCWQNGSINSSELSKDILQIYTSGIKSAAEISEDFIIKIIPILVNEFLEFLKRYKRSIENYHKKNKAIPQFKETIIANMNCCSHFRDFIEHASAGEDEKQKIYSILNEIEDQGFGILLQDLFEGIKSHFRGISQTKGLNNQEIMWQIITTANTYISSITTLAEPCRQVMAGKIHANLVTKYLTEMKDIRRCNIEQQRALAAQMENTADLFNQFCITHLNDAQMSEAKWRNDAIRNIADIIQLQDLDAIKLVVGALTHKYPDLRKRHVKAILYIKNNLKTSERVSVVQIMETITKTTDHPQRQLFAYIPCMPCCCLLF